MNRTKVIIPAFVIALVGCLVYRSGVSRDDSGSLLLARKDTGVAIMRHTDSSDGFTYALRVGKQRISRTRNANLDKVRVTSSNRIQSAWFVENKTLHILDLDELLRKKIIDKSIKLRGNSEIYNVIVNGNDIITCSSSEFVLYTNSGSYILRRDLTTDYGFIETCPVVRISNDRVLCVVDDYARGERLCEIDIKRRTIRPIGPPIKSRLITVDPIRKRIYTVNSDTRREIDVWSITPSGAKHERSFVLPSPGPDYERIRRVYYAPGTDYLFYSMSRGEYLLGFLYQYLPIPHHFVYDLNTGVSGRAFDNKDVKSSYIQAWIPPR